MKIKPVYTLVAAGCLVFLLACNTASLSNIDLGKLASAGSKVVTGNSLSIEQQQGVGEQMAAAIIGSSKVHQNQALQKYVNKVGRWLAMQSSVGKQSDGKIDWQFVVIDTPDFNAFSMPGGYVVISSGVIDRLSSEAELAAVLAHEVVHVEQNHQVKAIEKSSRLSGLTDLAMLAGDQYQAGRGSYGAEDLAKRQLAEGVANIVQNLYTKGLGRDDELDADQKAVVLMTRAGYDPYAYLTVMQIAASVDDGKKALLLATHPKADDRIKVAYQSLQYVEPYAGKGKVVDKRFWKSVK